MLVKENLEDILKPKSKEEINNSLDFVESIEDLVEGELYYVFDGGTEKWMADFTFNTKYDDYKFVSAWPFDYTEIEFTEEELKEAIKNKEIANQY